MRKLLIRPKARLDLLQIWHHIAAENLSAANRMTAKLEGSIRNLVPMPGQGHSRADVIDPRFRFWGVRPYVIAYRYDEETVIVERVVHGRRNFRRLFKRR